MSHRPRTGACRRRGDALLARDFAHLGRCLPATALLAQRQQPFAVGGVYTGIALAPAGIVVPGERRLQRRAGRGRLRQKVQSQRQDLSLNVASPGRAAGIAKRKVGKHEAGDAAVLDDVTSRADDDGCDAVGFKMSCDQTHGLVAYRSQRGQQCGIGAVRAGDVQDLRGVHLDGLALTEFGGHADELRS